MAGSKTCHLRRGKSLKSSGTIFHTKKTNASKSYLYELKIMSESPEEIASFFENQMRKGFLSIITLHILNENPCHGYKIMHEVQKHTNNVWSPPLPTVYLAMRTLEKKGLINLAREIETGRRKSKEYEITPLGKDTLALIADKLKDMLKPLRSILISIFGLDVNYMPEDVFW